MKTEFFVCYFYILILIGKCVTWQPQTSPGQPSDSNTQLAAVRLYCSPYSPAYCNHHATSCKSSRSCTGLGTPIAANLSPCSFSYLPNSDTRPRCILCPVSGQQYGLAVIVLSVCPCTLIRLVGTDSSQPSCVVLSEPFLGQYLHQLPSVHVRDPTK